MKLGLMLIFKKYQQNLIVISSQIPHNFTITL